MNERDLKTSERIASQLMRILAIIGLISILALCAWLLVAGIRLLPRAGEGMGSAVTAITSVFRSAPHEQISFDISDHTITANEPVTFAWHYTGSETAPTYRFLYECTQGVGMFVRIGSAWNPLACNETYTLTTTNVTALPSTTDRYTDVNIQVAVGSVSDTTLITIMNKDVMPANSYTPTSTTATTTAAPTRHVTTPTIAPQTTRPATVVQPITPPATPADLSVNIEETGIVTDVAGKRTFFALSPIPTTKTAAVRFTVTNNGGSPSGAWAFTARLPVEGDSDYKYASPVQASLAPNAQVEFTLSFDEVLKGASGTISIEVLPTQKTDSKGNNTDATKITLK